MEVSVQDKKEFLKELEIQLPPQEVNKRLTEAYQRIKKDAFVPGFRKGKVPLPLLKLHFRKVIEEEVKQALVDEFYQKAIEEKGLQAVSSPEIEVLEFGEGKGLKFKAQVEVIPPIELGDFEGEEVEEEKISVTDEDVEAIIQWKREEWAEYREVKERPSVKGDILVVDLEVYVEGKKIRSAKDIRFTLGDKSFSPSIEKALTGVYPGEEKEVKVKEKDKEVTYRFKVKGIKEKRLIALDENFVKRMGGVGTLQDLRKKIREELEELARAREREMLERKILDKVIEKSKMEIPPSLLEKVRNYYRVGGSALREEEKKEQALQEIKRFLIIKEIARRYNIQVSEEELEKRRKKISEEGSEEEKRRWLPEENKEDLRDTMEREKVIEFLKSKMKIKKKRKVILTPEEARRLAIRRQTWREKGGIIIPAE